MSNAAIDVQGQRTSVIFNRSKYILLECAIRQHNPQVIWLEVQLLDEEITYGSRKLVALAEALDCGTYFSRPCHSWERGQNENANSLLCQYFPKTMGLVDIAMKQVFEAVDKLRGCFKTSQASARQGINR